MELPLVVLVTLNGGTEERVFSWVPLGVCEVTALLSVPLAVTVLPLEALAEMEHDAGN